MSAAFKIAAGYIMPFGQHRGKTIDAIATTDDGLSYLDWLRGELEQTQQHRSISLDRATDAIATTDDGLSYLDWLRGELEQTQQHRSISLDRATAYGHICTYLDDATIASDVARLAKGKA